MLQANIELIPLPDMLGQPITPWISLFLMALTLALHWVFIAITIGGTVFYLSSKQDASEQITQARHGLASFLPFSLSMAMTLGIAPLLFVQVLYGNFFYSSTIMIGWVWMGLLPLTAANLYLLFAARHQDHKNKPVRFIVCLVLLLMAATAIILSSNTTLMQNPQDWDSFRTSAANKPYLADATLLPRWSFAMSVLFAAGNLFTALYLRFKLEVNEFSKRKITAAVKRALAGIVAALLTGFWTVSSLGVETKEILFAGKESIFVYAAIVSLVVTLIMTVLSLGAKMFFIFLGSVTFFLSLLSLAFTRDTLRRIALREYFDLYQIPVNAQWSSLILFLVLFVSGLGVVAYMVYLAITSQQKPVRA